MKNLQYDILSSCNFSLRHYFEVLENARNNYDYVGSLKGLSTVKKKDKFIVLRHDVDISLEHALKIAHLESKHDLHSTFFILLHSPFYNALARKSANIISRISKLGHEIGLHYDTTFLPKSLSNAHKQLKNEIRILENISGQKIISVTQHNPTTTVKMNLKLTSGFLDAMHNILTKNAMYISDSVQNWRKGCMCNHVGKINKLQILTHPIWWQEVPMSIDKILKNMSTNQNIYMNSEFKFLEDFYKNYLFDVKNNPNR
ncbi:MAG: hypothetical protein ABI340_08200 [Nitrososphaera sp.]|jgi:hypothetical protein